jgi:hypothetical protein
MFAKCFESYRKKYYWNPLKQRKEKGGGGLKAERATEITEIQFNKYLLSSYQTLNPGPSTKICKALTRQCSRGGMGRKV